MGPYSLNLLYSKEPLQSKDFLYFLPFPLFLYSLNLPQTEEPNFLSLTFKKPQKSRKSLTFKGILNFDIH